MSALPQAPEKDPRVQSAISHWAPRFVANGVPLSDFEQVTAGCERWEDWCSAWSARAAQHEELGVQALAQGYKLSAGAHFTRAGVCYHFGKFLFVNDLAQMKAAHTKAVECRNRALPLIAPPGERVAIAYEGKFLYGNLRKPAGVAKPPVVVMCMGLDSAKEEMDDYENRFLNRGLATFAFDGPGQGEGEYDFALCPEYEKPVKAVIDCLEKRMDIDSSAIGIWGVSLGGYFAPRAACFEKRIKACVALSGAYQRSSNFDGRPVINVEAFRVRSKSANLEEAGRVALRMSLAGIAKNISCPIYLVAGTKDRLTPHTAAEKLAAEVSGPCVLSVIEGGNHVVNNLWYRYRDQTADWMATQLGATKR
ncbi:MAG: alpha/beta hydrolase [Proteobacteria bacterium]|nr:alpha/beta hydrolase [Pseudomonadota bacterium]